MYGISYDAIDCLFNWQLPVTVRKSRTQPNESSCSAAGTHSLRGRGTSRYRYGHKDDNGDPTDVLTTAQKATIRKAFRDVRMLADNERAIHDLYVKFADFYGVSWHTISIIARDRKRAGQHAPKAPVKCCDEQVNIERKKASQVPRSSSELPPVVLGWISQLASNRKQEYAKAYASAKLNRLPEPPAPSFSGKDWPQRVRCRIDRLIRQAKPQAISSLQQDKTREHNSDARSNVEESKRPPLPLIASYQLNWPSPTTPIRELVPGLEEIAMQSIPYRRLPRLVTDVLSDHIETWYHLGCESISSLMSNYGATELIVRILLDAARDAAVESGLPAINYLPPDSIGPSASYQISALEPAFNLVLRWSSLMGRNKPLPLREILAFDRLNVPDDVGRALWEIEHFAFMNTPAGTTPVDAVNEILELLDFREREVLIRRLTVDTPETLEAIAGRLDVTRERVRQIQQKGQANLARLLSTTSNRAVTWYAHEIRRILGPYLPYTAAEVRLHNLSIPMPSETASLLLYLAGPYKRTNGDDWIENIAISGRELVASAITKVFSAAPSAAHETLLGGLQEVGMRSDDAEAYLRQKVKLRQWNGRWIRWQGSAVEKARAVLELLGEPATAETVTEVIGEGYSVNTVQNGMSQDPRFMRTGKRKWGLRAWGIEEYSGIAEEIMERIDSAGGSVNVEHLVRELVDTFPDISENSVRMYLGTPAFLVEGGSVRRRTDDDEWPVSSEIRDARGAFLTSDNELRLAILVTRDVLRGSGQSIHEAVALALGVTPGRERTFTSPDEISLRVRWRPWSTSGPDIGSVRALATATDAQIGDMIVLIFRLDDDTVEGVTIPAGIEGQSKLAIILGVDQADDFTALIAHSLKCRASEVRSTLRARGDADLADFIPSVKDSRLESQIEDLIAQLR